MERNFYDYDGLQPKMTNTKHWHRQCNLAHQIPTRAKCLWNLKIMVNLNWNLKWTLQGTNLVGIDYYFALFLVSACDEQHVVERRRVIENWVIFEGIEYVAGSKFEQMDTSLIDSHPQSLGPIRGEWLLKIVKIIVNTFNKNNWVHKENFWLRVGQKFDFGGDILKIIVFCL